MGSSRRKSASSAFALSHDVQEQTEADAFLSHLGELKDLHRDALVIAWENLLSGMEIRSIEGGGEKLVLNAGMRNFREPWARDFGFASYGLLAVKEFKVVRETIETFLRFQKEDGQFPIKVFSNNTFWRTVHSVLDLPQPTHRPLRPRYVSGHNSISPDGNALLISAVLNYAIQSRDEVFLKRHWHSLEQAIRWLKAQAPDDDGLIVQGPFSDWADTIGRTGKILYTNVVYWKALHDMARAAKGFGLDAKHAEFSARSTQISASLQTQFCREDLGYCVTSREFDNLNTSGNLLAICWGCLSPQQSNRALDKIKEFGLDYPVPTKPVNFGYPRRMIALEARLGRFPYYHVNAAWLWLGSLNVIALASVGRFPESEELLDRLASLIVRDKVVYEVYKENGKPFSNLLYKSEAPLTWSAGMIIYCFHQHHRHLHSETSQNS